MQMTNKYMKISLGQAFSLVVNMPLPTLEYLDLLLSSGSWIQFLVMPAWRDRNDVSSNCFVIYTDGLHCDLGFWFHLDSPR